MTSFMDVIACGLGAAILLFLLGASAQSGLTDGPQSDTILIRCTHESGPPASIGIEFQPPGSSVWKLADTHIDADNGFVLASSSQGVGRMVSFFLLYTPAAGEWRFRPVMLDYATIGSSDETRVRITVAGRNARIIGDSSNESVLRQVGLTGEEVVVKIARADN